MMSNIRHARRARCICPVPQRHLPWLLAWPEAIAGEYVRTEEGRGCTEHGLPRLFVAGMTLF